MSPATLLTSLVQVCSMVPCHCRHCSFQTMERMVILQHLFQAHANEQNFDYLCGISNCCCNFKPGSTYSGFLTHCKRKHPGWRSYLAECTVHDDDDGSHSPSDSDGSGDTNHDTMDIEEGAAMEVIATDSHEEDIHDVDINVIGAHFLLNLKERHKLTQVAIDYILDAVSDLNEIITNKHKQIALRKLKELGYDTDVTSTLLNECFVPTNPFLHLRTEYEQTKFYKEHFGLIVSSYI